MRRLRWVLPLVMLCLGLPVEAMAQQLDAAV